MRIFLRVDTVTLSPQVESSPTFDPRVSLDSLYSLFVLNVSTGNGRFSSLLFLTIKQVTLSFSIALCLSDLFFLLNLSLVYRQYSLFFFSGGFIPQARETPPLLLAPSLFTLVYQSFNFVLLKPNGFCISSPA